MKTPTKRKRQPDSNSRPSSAPGIPQGGVPHVHGGGHPQFLGGLQQVQNDPATAALSSHINPAMSSYQGDLVCHHCDFRCDNPQSLALHQQTHQHVQQQQPAPTPPGFKNEPYQGQLKEEQPYMNYHDPYMDFKAEEEHLNQHYQQHMYSQQQHPPYNHHHHQPYEQNYHHSSHGYHHYPPQPGPHPPHHMVGYDHPNNHQQYHYQHQQTPQHAPPPTAVAENHYMHPQHPPQQGHAAAAHGPQGVPPPAPGQDQVYPPQGHMHGHPPPQVHPPPPPQGHHPQQIMSPPPYHQQHHQQPQQMHPNPAAHPNHHHQVPPEHQQQHYQHPPPSSHMMPTNPSYSNDVDAKVTPEEKLINEALMNDQNGNMDNYQHQHQYHDNYSHLQSPSNVTNNQQSSPRHHHQNGGGHGRHTNNDPVLTSSSSAAKTGSSGSGSPAGAGGKQRRVNIGKMFQTHICYVCDARLAKLDCIKMHFKNRHPETSLDLNKVMISRVVCYLCGVRKKEYAILNRHFQVEHRGVEIDPFQIGMDAPTPFNLSPEEEADLVKLPIPEPVKQEDMKRVRSFMERVDRAATTAEMINDNTMDSMDSTSINDMSFEQQVKEAEVELHQSPNAAFHPHSSSNNHLELQTSITSTKSNTNTNVFNHHSTTTPPPGSDNTNISDPSSRKKPRKTRGFKNNKCLICGKTFSRITTLKKHFNEQHPNELYDKSKIEITQLPCYMCEAKFTDSRHAIRHFETNHPEVEYDTYKIQVPGLEMTNGANDDYDQEDSSSAYIESKQDINNLLHANQDEDVYVENNGANIKNTTSGATTITTTEEFSKKKKKFKNNKCLICGKTSSRITTLKKHFNEQHPNELYDKSKIEITQLPCYMCEAKFTDSRHAIRHFETNHPEVEYDTYKIQVPGLEMTNGANDDYDQEDSSSAYIESKQDINNLLHANQDEDVYVENNGANIKNTTSGATTITTTEEFSKKTTKYFENNAIDFTEKQNAAAAADEESNVDGNNSSSNQKNHNQNKHCDNNANDSLNNKAAPATNCVESC